MGMGISAEMPIVGYQAILYILTDQQRLFNGVEGIADCAYDFLYQNKFYGVKCHSSLCFCVLDALVDDNNGVFHLWNVFRFLGDQFHGRK
jgi:hypothetical protein